jgi:pyruvate/2-oxoglutarate dehydrogenase complex dihydrolipoamide dehydrogenase (E3) component
MIKAEAPDTVILATGSKNLVPRIPGLDPANILEPTEVLLGKKVTGQKVLVCGGGLIGAETANFLAEQKRDVTIVEMKDGFVMDLDPYAKPMLLREMQESGIKMMASTAIQSFLPDGITYKNLLKKDPEVETLDGFDSIVLALGHKAYNPLEEAVKEICNEVYVIGDARKAGFVWGATYEAADIAMNI